MVKPKEIVVYSLKEIATMFDLSEQSISNKLNKLKIKRLKISKKGYALYSMNSVNLLRNSYNMVDILYEDIKKNYKTNPIIITYYIYESKMNN